MAASENIYVSLLWTDPLNGRQNNAHARYDEPAENIMTIEIPQQLKIYYKDNFTLKTFFTLLQRVALKDCPGG